MEYAEVDFEESIERALLSGGPDAYPDDEGIREASPPWGDYAPGGYRKRKPEHYDRALCLDPEVVYEFIVATQPKEWEKLKAQYGDEARERFLKRLKSQIDKRGTLDVLRRGVKDVGAKLQMAYFRPSSGLNPELQKLYQANMFTVVRQLAFSEEDTQKTLDMTLFLNGLPIFTVELKNPLTGQNVENAVWQYRNTRDPREPLFAFGRCLAHFAVDPDMVQMTTHLQGPETRFLPFNQGWNGGAGNPRVLQGFRTSYLWEYIWSRDSVLNLIRQFIQVVDVLDDKGDKTGEQQLIFPRYHQLDAVRRLVADAKANGTGQRYLIHHSAGSGKSNSIAWLAHQLSVLHDANDERVFDSIVIISDRRVLDRQLQENVKQFEQTLGVVENIETTSRQLKDALEEGKTIIVTTLQKFPVIVNEIEELGDRTFALIIDEAHSSQSGESVKSLKSVLGNLEEAEKEEAEQPETMEDRVIAEMRERGHPPNMSSFAFTATPKPQTLELFGTLREDGTYGPFSWYSMRQAIEENFILDVLENYTTYKAYWNLLKTIEDDPRYDRDKAQYLLRAFVDLHEHAVEQKVALMVDHFAEHVAPKIGGLAKAMIVTRSRLHAVRYKLAVDRYLKENGDPFKALVAFSGTVTDGGYDYTESNMNGFPERQTVETFKQDEYRIMIAAYKFQTGFDQPLLHTMYVDKKLSGVHAVQTLSRLNRVYPGKEQTMVLDFANEAADIQQSFEPYYDRTILSKGTDPNLLYTLQLELSNYYLFTEADIDQFAQVYFDPKGAQEALYVALRPSVERYNDASDDDKVAFRGKLAEYVRLYAFLSQVVRFVDADLEKLYVFGRLLLRYLPVERDQLPVEIQQNIDLDSYRLQSTFSGSLGLERGQAEMGPAHLKGEQVIAPEDLEPLSQIIEALNERYGTDFAEEDKVFIRQLEERLADNAALEASFRVNAPENARLTFDHVVADQLQAMMEKNFKFFKQINDDPDFGAFFFEWLFGRYQESLQSRGA